MKILEPDKLRITRQEIEDAAHWDPRQSRIVNLIRQRMRHLEADLKKSLEEKLYMSNIKVGDRVEAPRHGRGTVLAIVGGDAWVRTEGKDYPLTFDVKKLKLVPKPRVGILGVIIEDHSWSGSKAASLHWNVEAVELTPEVRERLAGLL